MINAVSFAISAGIVAVSIPSFSVEQQLDALGGARVYLSGVADGFLFLLGNPLLSGMLLAGSVGSLIAEPLYAVILPVYANEVLGCAAQLGLIFAALGAGSIVGNLIYVLIESRFSRSTIYLSGFALRAVAFSVMLMMPPWWVIAIPIFVGAVSLEPVNPLTMSVFQEQVPSGMRGRIFGVSSAIHVVTLPVGVVVYGFLMSGLGLERTLEIFVVLNLALPMGMALIPTLRNIPRVEGNRQMDRSSSPP